MNLLYSFYKILNEKRIFYLLLSVNILISLFVFNISSKITFPDAKGYWLMGESILHGKFSSWYFFSKYYPETLRTPGYPVFLAMCQLITSSPLFVKIFQLFIYFSSVFISTLIIKRINTNLIFRNLFLLLLIPNVQVVYYTGLISTEIIAMFFVVLTMYLVISKKSIINALLLAIFCYCAFIIRPVFLLFPFILFVYFIINDKKNFKYSFIFILMYITLLLPFGLWNKANHGVFKITTIEGAAGTMHLSFWALKLPDGYKESFYWGNTIGYDLTKPKFYSTIEEIENVKKFENECTSLWSGIKKFETKEDSINLVKMKNNNSEIFLLHNSTYTIEREKLLMQVTIQNILNEPNYYIKSRIYQLIRTYITGINYKNLRESHSFIVKLKIIYPFVATLVFIFLGLIFITMIVIFKKIHFVNISAFILLFWYYGIMHLPFTIQARYSIPIHLLILAILSVTILKTIKSSYE